MTHLDAWILAFALAMDCFAVSVAGGVVLRRVQWRPMLLMAFFFGLFQAMNPLFGWAGTAYFRDVIESVDHWIAFFILLFLGVRMVVGNFKEGETKFFNPKSLRVVLVLAVATSIDAFAVGISFTCMGLQNMGELLYPLSVIGFVSSLMTLAGLLFGIAFGRKYARTLQAELWGGIILILIGCKVLVEHTMC